MRLQQVGLDCMELFCKVFLLFCPCTHIVYSIACKNRIWERKKERKTYGKNLRGGGKKKGRCSPSRYLWHECKMDLAALKQPSSSFLALEEEPGKKPPPAVTTHWTLSLRNSRGERALLLFFTNLPLQCLISTSKHWGRGISVLGEHIRDAVTALTSIDELFAYAVIINFHYITLCDYFLNCLNYASI